MLFFRYGFHGNDRQYLLEIVRWMEQCKEILAMSSFDIFLYRNQELIGVF